MVILRTPTNYFSLFHIFENQAVHHDVVNAGGYSRQTEEYQPDRIVIKVALFYLSLFSSIFLRPGTLALFDPFSFGFAFADELPEGLHLLEGESIRTQLSTVKLVEDVICMCDI
jgi:hypothetical protein